MRSRVCAAAIVFLSAALLLFGCGNKQESQKISEAEDGEKKIEIGFSFDSFVIERWVKDRDVFISTAQSLGAEVNVQNANGDPDEQVSQIRYLIDSGVDVLVIVANDGDALTDIVKEAEHRGIHVICYDRLVPNAGSELYVSIDSVETGRLMAQAMVDALADGGNIFFINGPSTDENTELLAQGIEEVLEGTNVEISYKAECENWLGEIAFDEVQNGIRAVGVPEGIICGNDDLAGNAIRALSELRLAGKIPVVAQDAELAGCQRIVEGTQLMTVYKPFDQEARAAAHFSVRLGNGKSLTDNSSSIQVRDTINDGSTNVPYYSIAPQAVTKENIREVIIDSGFHREEEVYLNVLEDSTEA